MGAVVDIAIAVQEAVVDALAESRLVDDVSGRQLLLQMINAHLPYELTILDQPNARNWLIEVVNGCAELEGGLDALARAVRVMQPHSIVYERVQRIVNRPHLRDLLPSDELDLLRDCLGAMVVPELQILVRRATGLGPAPPPFDGDVWEAVTYLSDRNVEPDGFPPLMSFIELVACQITGQIKKNLLKWNDDQALRMGLQQQLRKRRGTATKITQNTTLHLMVAVEHDGIDPTRCLVSSWRQDDPEPWPPPLTSTASLRIDELERWVDQQVVSAERAWSDHAGAVALEIVLPRALLQLPIHRWQKEHDTGNPRPLWLDYSIVRRSLERMRSPHWHRLWRQRWRTLTEDPATSRIHFGRIPNADERYPIDAVLSDPRWVMAVLATAPTAEPMLGSDELTAALRSGLPALVWHSERAPDDLREIIDELTADGGLIELPNRVLALRREEAVKTVATPVEVVRDFFVLWDDPSRLVVFDQPPVEQPLLRGDIADEREQAS